MPSLYAILSVVVSGRMANWVQSGFRAHVNQAYIISTKFEEISDAKDIRGQGFVPSSVEDI